MFFFLFCFLPSPLRAQGGYIYCICQHQRQQEEQKEGPAGSLRREVRGSKAWEADYTLSVCLVWCVPRVIGMLLLLGLLLLYCVAPLLFIVAREHHSLYYTRIHPSFFAERLCFVAETRRASLAGRGAGSALVENRRRSSKRGRTCGCQGLDPTVSCSTIRP